MFRSGSRRHWAHRCQSQRIGKTRGVVQHVRIAVEGLGVGYIATQRVGAQPAALIKCVLAVRSIVENILPIVVHPREDEAFALPVLSPGIVQNIVEQAAIKGGGDSHRVEVVLMKEDDPAINIKTHPLLTQEEDSCRVPADIGRRVVPFRLVRRTLKMPNNVSSPLRYPDLLAQGIIDQDDGCPVVYGDQSPFPVPLVAVRAVGRQIPRRVVSEARGADPIGVGIKRPVGARPVGLPVHQRQLPAARPVHDLSTTPADPFADVPYAAPPVFAGPGNSTRPPVPEAQEEGSKEDREHAKNPSSLHSTLDGFLR